MKILFRERIGKHWTSWRELTLYIDEGIPRILSRSPVGSVLRITQKDGHAKEWKMK